MWVQDFFTGHGKKSVCRKNDRRKLQTCAEIPRIDHSLGMLIPYSMGKCMLILPMLFTEKKNPSQEGLLAQAWCQCSHMASVSLERGQSLLVAVSNMWHKHTQRAIAGGSRGGG